MSFYQDTERRALISGLRDLATFLEDHPEIPTPITNPANAFVYGKEEMEKVVRVMGSVKKRVTEEYFFVQKAFGSVTLEVNCRRELICERRVIGKKIIPAQPEREVEEVAWDCGTIFDREKETA